MILFEVRFEKYHAIKKTCLELINNQRNFEENMTNFVKAVLYPQMYRKVQGH